LYRNYFYEKLTFKILVSDIVLGDENQENEYNDQQEQDNQESNANENQEANAYNLQEEPAEEENDAEEGNLNSYIFKIKILIKNK
jgi:hypothetical protein